ncbi:MAG: redoxin domain-containing protein [Desulfobacterota bacterium]|nr:redoxin domain-containing protein [Thermodesulfobacteriota bacterium]
MMICIRIRTLLFMVLFSCWFVPPATDICAQEPQPTFNPTAYKGKYLLVLLFSIDDPRAPMAMDLMKELYTRRRDVNMEVAAVCLNTGKDQEARRFTALHHPPFPVFLDTSGSFAQSLRITSGLGLVIYGKDGNVIATKDASPSAGQSDLSSSWKGFINRYIPIGYTPDDVPVLGYKPPFPVFEAIATNGATINIKSILGKKPFVFVIFSPSCSHCQHELEFLQTQYTSQEFKGKLEIIAVSRGDTTSTDALVKKKKLSFPVLLDTNSTITARFPSFIGSVPLSYLVDRNGTIAFQHTGFSEYTADNYLMELRKLCGLPNPPLLNPSGYSGEERCKVCHERQHIQWSLTRHADAYLSLVRKGSEHDPACVSCHVTGFGRSGGFNLEDKKTARRLEGVQCESCHGPGATSCTAFTKVKDNPRTRAQWEMICRSCHTEKESLNFKFEHRFPKVIHTAVPDLSSMSSQDREAFIQNYRQKKNLFDNPASYVGAANCKSCHEEQYRHWQTTLHATAHTTPQARSAPADKSYRYHTGVENPGGYPEPGREGVQCEACHGPGERHVKEPNKKGHDYIVSLSQECSSCVVEQICRRCHSPGDDPRFDFDAYIPRIRHPKTSTHQKK